MHHYTQGQPTRQGHKGIPEGYFEEEQGLRGFFGPVSHLIKKQPSTRWLQIEGPLRPHMYDIVALERTENMQRLLYNSSLTLAWHSMPAQMAPQAGFRNADGDSIYFCHSGEGEVYTEYGQLSYKKGSYIVIPKCLTHTLSPRSDSQFLFIEARNSHFQEPERGIVGRHAVYDINALGKPDLEAQNAQLSHMDQVRTISVKRNNQITRFEYADGIYDTIGWKGDLFPFTLHVDHMMPLMSHRAHLPPSAHTTFVAKEFVVCTFLPRPLEQDADALKVPFYHQNIDYDEVLFYHEGDFFSRDNLHAGMMSWHPAGFPHGPHPKAMKSVGAKTQTNEYAVMIDAREPLVADESLAVVELKNYWQSWQSK